MMDHHSAYPPENIGTLSAMVKEGNGDAVTHLADRVAKPHKPTGNATDTPNIGGAQHFRQAGL